MLKTRAIADAAPINPRHVVYEVSPRLPADAIVTSDAGSCANWYARSRQVKRGQRGYKRLRFAGVRIVTLSEGEVSELHIGLKGTMGALFLKDLGDKTRRGQVGRASHRDASRAASATATAAW